MILIKTKGKTVEKILILRISVSKILTLLVLKVLFSNSTTQSIYLETNYIKMISTIEGPLFNTGLESANKMKVQINLNLPSYYNSNKINKEEVERTVSKILQSNLFLDKHKKSILKIKFDILEYSADFTHYCLMIASLACSHLGIEQRGILTCSNICMLQDGRSLVDPTLLEESYSKSKFQIACLIDTEEVISFNQNGIVEDKIIENQINTKFMELIALSISVCKAYRNYIIKQL